MAAAAAAATAAAALGVRPTRRPMPRRLASRLLAGRNAPMYAGLAIVALGIGAALMGIIGKRRC